MNRFDRIKLEVFIQLACDADYQRLANGSSQSGWMTVAEALETVGTE